jgi:molecular chaperone Hsp33
VNTDSLRRLLFENTRIRGLLVSVDETFRSATRRHEYPGPVRELVGESLAATALLAATIKFDGSLALRVQSAGPVHLLVAQITGNRALRGLARWRGDVAPGPLSSLTGAGHLAMTIDTGPGEDRYQGVVELEGATLAAAVDTYFARSEQLPTRLWLAADGSRAAGMLLQKLPGGEATDDESWRRVVLLAETITRAELVALDGEDVLRRLFHEEDVRVFEPAPLRFECTCSRETIESLIRAFGREEADAIVREEGGVHASCEFCNRRFDLDAVDVAALFSANVEGTSTPQ